MRITVVNATERFTERLRLHQTATGQQLADLSIPELLAGTGVRVRARLGDRNRRRRADRADRRRTRSGYDTLVYALGSVADTATVPGVDGPRVHPGQRRRTPSCSRAGWPRWAAARVVVCGSGLTGVEAAAEIAERYPALRVVLLGRQRTRRRDGPEGQGVPARRAARLGVRVRSGVEIVKVLPDARRAGGRRRASPADAVLWTSGVRVSPLAAAAGLTVDERGRIVTDATLRSVSHPEVYAVGDAAAIRQGYGVMHGTCQSGMPTGVHAAASIVRELRRQAAQAVPLRLLPHAGQPGPPRRGRAVHPPRRQPPAGRT